MIISPVWDDPVILSVKEEYWNIDHLKTTIFGEEENTILAKLGMFTLILWSETNPRSFFLKDNDLLDYVYNLKVYGQRGGNTK